MARISGHEVLTKVELDDIAKRIGEDHGGDGAPNWRTVRKMLRGRHATYGIVRLYREVARGARLPFRGGIVRGRAVYL